MLSKRGEMTWEEILGVVLGAGAVLIMAVLLFRLIAPSFDVNDETAEGYFDLFMEGIGVADSGGTGGFLMWQPEEDVHFYVVYFGDRVKVEGGGAKFSFFADNENAVCLCYVVEEESKCWYCENLRHPATYAGELGSWVFGSQNEVEIVKGEGVYEIVKV
jgi:hypothetical protein